LDFLSDMAGKVFINYRRGDDAGNTGRLFDRLQDAFKPEQLFMDVDSIAPGQDFVRVLEEQVAKCDVFLVVIGKNWIYARDSAGKRRLDRPDDFVRTEIELALSHDKRVIPVLVGGARMPRPDELPETIRPLVRRNAVRLTHERFKSDAQGLTKAIQEVLDDFESIRKAQPQTESEAQKLWDRIRGSATRQDVVAFLEKYSKSTLAVAARARLELLRERETLDPEEAAWRGVRDSLNPQDFDRYLASFPAGAHASIAESRAKRLRADLPAWKEAEWNNSVEAYEKFLATATNSPFSVEAEARLSRLQLIRKITTQVTTKGESLATWAKARWYWLAALAVAILLVFALGGR
jgi:hypothetical protein